MLNPFLYDKLTKACYKGMPKGLGGGKVLIKDQGANLQGSYVMDYAQTPPRKKLNIVAWGETYRVCCPYCSDTRHRLYINHRWNERDPETKSMNRGLIHCFNENCEKLPDFYDDLVSRLDVLQNMLGKRNAAPIITNINQVPKPINWPGEMIKLSQLSDLHPAKVYLKKENFNPDHLESNFNVQWCQDSNLVQARHRLVVPVYHNKELMGWQARYVDMNGDGNCSDLYLCQNRLCQYQWRFSSEGKPKACPSCAYSEVPPQPVVKWYTSPGAHFASLLLNYDNARAWPFVVVMEGPKDVWRLGTPKRQAEPGPGVCVFKHILSQPQLVRLLPWQKSNGPIFLCFDDDVFEKTITQANALRPHFPGGVIPVRLPTGKDPGDMNHKELWNSIRAAATEYKCGLFEEYKI